MFNLENITRNNIRKMKPYSSARDEFKGEASIWLDANENPIESAINRYPDPQQQQLKKVIANKNGVDADQVFIGNGSDEAIDLLFRAFCEPGIDKAIIFPPTYGMYGVSAAINNIEVVELPLNNDFQLPSIESIKDQLKSVGLLFICSPNNPTGNVMDKEAIKQIAQNFYGLVVVDEAYIDFSSTQSSIELLDELPNLVVLRTFSKAWGMAGLRLGMAFASNEIVSVLNKIKPPYNVNALSQNTALEILSKSSIKEQVKVIKEERERLVTALNWLDIVQCIYPSEANFLLVQFDKASYVFEALQKKGIIVRDRSNHIENCLRITVGTADENTQLVKALKEI